MKKFLFVLLILPSILFAQTEQYYVTFLKGIVLMQRTKQPLKIGDKLSAADKLIFKDKQGKVACISPGKGRFEINAQQANVNEDGELLAVLKSNLLPISNTYHLSTRSLLFEGYNPKTYFQSAETNNRILLLTDQALPIEASYKIEPGNFFFVQYTLNGKTITRKIEQSTKGLVFSPSLFSNGTDFTIAEKVMLCYQSKENGQARSAVLAEFIPVLASAATIKEQIAVVTKYTNATNPKTLNAEIAAHIFENFGKIGLEELAALAQ